MPDRLYRLVYRSRFGPEFPAAPADQDHEIGRIIQASIRRNRADDITGLLLVAGERFLQVLEGPRRTVEAAYARIMGDPRHADLQLMAGEAAERRLFADWNMCAHRLSRADDAILAALGERPGFDLYGLEPDRALRLLSAVREAQAAALAAGMI
jgi:hypothetical protein